MAKRSPLGGWYFSAIVKYRWPVIILCTFLVVLSALALPQLRKDTTSSAFFAPDNPAVLYREQVRQEFGLADPIVVAVVNDGPNGIYNTESLELVAWLTEKIQAVENVDPERVVSLATESNVVGTETGMDVTPFLENGPWSGAEVEKIRDAVHNFPLYNGKLVSRAGQGAVIVVELLDENLALETYEAIQRLLLEAPVGPGDQMLIAGEGAVAGFLSSYIDRDAQRLNPLAGIVITAILFFAFRTLRATLLPNLIILGTAVTTLGLMAFSGTPFYVITNGLIVCMIGIAVADSIHAFSQYYEERELDTRATQADLVVRSMRAVVKPITLTTITTSVGFLALYPSSDMPPVQAFGVFGVFGAVAVVVAWFYSMTLFPAVLSLLKPKSSPAFSITQSPYKQGISNILIHKLGLVILNHPKTVILIWLALVLVGAVGVGRVTVEDQRIENFKSTESLYIADKQLNTLLDGTYYLDVVVEVTEEEGLNNPTVLKKIEALQQFLESQPHVNGSTSVADYVKQMHKAVNENKQQFYTLPDNEDLIAQLFLLYTISGDPTDFEEEINSSHSKALVRAHLDSNAYANNKIVVPRVEQYIAEVFNDEDVTATLSGRVKVDFHWIDAIAQSHAGSVLLSICAVLITASLVFRSLVVGLLATAPVVVSILVIYAVMGFTGVWLSISTSMFAAIAIGLGVDFSIHTVEKIRELGKDAACLSGRFTAFFQTTGRALLVNLLAISLGFGVLCFSDVPPLVRFGGLVAVAVGSAFLASMTLLPALILTIKPSAIVNRERYRSVAALPRSVVSTAIFGAVLFIWVPCDTYAAAADDMNGRALMQLVADRVEGEQLTRDMHLQLIDRNGKVRNQHVRSFKRQLEGEKRTVLFYTSPKNLKGTGFLTYDYHDKNRDDDQWLYLSALRKVRRISSSSRGDYFLGTDFTYEEVKNDNKVDLFDYEFLASKKDNIEGEDCHWVEGIPIDTDTVKELGHARVQWCVNLEKQLSLKSEYWDSNGNHLKTIENISVKKVSGIWTVLGVKASNHKTGHSTVITSSNIDYESSIPERMYNKRSLKRGL